MVGDTEPKRVLRQHFIDTIEAKDGAMWQQMITRTTPKDASNQFIALLQQTEKASKQKAFTGTIAEHSKRVKLLDQYGPFRASVFNDKVQSAGKVISYMDGTEVKEVKLTGIKQTLADTKGVVSWAFETLDVFKLGEKARRKFFDRGGVSFNATNTEGKPVSVFMWLENGAPVMNMSSDPIGAGKIFNAIKSNQLLGSGNPVKSISQGASMA